MSNKRNIKKQFRAAHFAEEDLDDLAAAAEAMAKAGYMPETDPDVIMMSPDTWDAVKEITQDMGIKTKETHGSMLFGSMEIYLDDDLPFNEARQMPKSQALMILQQKMLTCSMCDGHGSLGDQEICEDCKGSGKVKRKLQ